LLFEKKKKKIEWMDGVSFLLKKDEKSWAFVEKRGFF
jgi:hypothetical protein